MLTTTKAAPNQKVLIRGCGDVGSAVAHRLFQAGYRVAIHDDPRPTHTRRGMAFTDALFEHKAELSGVLAKYQSNCDGAIRMLDCGKALPVASGDFEQALSSLRPEILIDARMRKRSIPEALRGQARVTIGLGPNFVAGENADVAIETAWGDDLGSIIRQGRTRPLEGEPKEIRGHARDRYIYASASGLFVTACEIGMRVEQGQEVARIGRMVLAAPLSGRLRGLTHTDVYVEQGTKVIEIDPRGDDADIYGISERPRRIAEGVLSAVQGKTRSVAAPTNA
jgi:xanthine dehydrogenase accessory factor